MNDMKTAKENEKRGKFNKGKTMTLPMEERIENRPNTELWA